MNVFIFHLCCFQTCLTAEPFGRDGGGHLNTPLHKYSIKPSSKCCWYIYGSTLTIGSASNGLFDGADNNSLLIVSPVLQNHWSSASLGEKGTHQKILSQRVFKAFPERRIWFCWGKRLGRSQELSSCPFSTIDSILSMELGRQSLISFIKHLVVSSVCGNYFYPIRLSLRGQYPEVTHYLFFNFTCWPD